MKTLLLIDGSYYVYRSFFATPNLTNQQGEPTGAIYGFVKAVTRALRHVQPTHAAVVWDGIPKRRQALCASYKAHRSDKPEELTAQFPIIREIVPMMGMKNLRDEDQESDDLMASYASAVTDAMTLGFDESEWRVYLATADKDLLQCVSESVSIYSTAKADRGDAEFALLGANEVIDKWGVRPDQLGDVLALMGDESDNIEGVAGIGIKTAARLIRTRGSLESLLQSGDDTKGLQSQADRVRCNREMIRLDDDLMLPAPLESLALQPLGEEFFSAMAKCDIDAAKL